MELFQGISRSVDRGAPRDSRGCEGAAGVDHVAVVDEGKAKVYSETRVRTSQPKRIFCPCLSFTQSRADLVHGHESRSVTNLFRIEWNKLSARPFPYLETVKDGERYER